MVNKQEIIDVLELFKRNTVHALGENDEQVKTINTCIMLTEEVEDKQGYWQDISVIGNDECGIDMWQSSKCSACGHYVTKPFTYSLVLDDYCPHCGVSMKGQK